MSTGQKKKKPKQMILCYRAACYRMNTKQIGKLLMGFVNYQDIRKCVENFA